MAPLWELLPGRAVIALGGHEHGMQRLRPIAGVTQLISAAGGRDLYGLDRDDERLAFGDDRQYGTLRLELHRSRADFAFVAADGAVLDRGTIRCRPS